MAGSSFGTIFRLTTWGESHGKGVGVVVDGVPAGLSLSEEDIQVYLDRRKPGQNRFTTKRKESDTVQILSGTFEGKTTGTPISMVVWNERCSDSAAHADRALIILGAEPRHRPKRRDDQSDPLFPPYSPNNISDKYTNYPLVSDFPTVAMRYGTAASRHLPEHGFLREPAQGTGRFTYDPASGLVRAPPPYL